MQSIKFYYHNLHQNNTLNQKIQSQEPKQNSYNGIAISKLPQDLNIYNIIKLWNVSSFQGLQKPKDKKLIELVYSIKHSNIDGVGDPLIYLLNKKTIPSNVETKNTIQKALESTKKENDKSIKYFQEALKIIDNNMKKKADYLGFRKSKS